MAGGLVALLDDVAALVKVTAASLDDIAAGAAKASTKAIGVVVDDEENPFDDEQGGVTDGNVIPE